MRFKLVCFLGMAVCLVMALGGCAVPRIEDHSRAEFRNWWNCGEWPEQRFDCPS